MPTPRKNEDKDKYIQRCMGQLVSEGKDSDQAYAICNSMWKEAKMSDKINSIFKGGTSFDYDGVLSTDKGKELAKRTTGTKYIISARSDKKSMLSTAKEVGISPDHIFATGSNKAKIEKIKELGTTHYDNNPDVIKEIPNGKLFK